MKSLNLRSNDRRLILVVLLVSAIAFLVLAGSVGANPLRNGETATFSGTLEARKTLIAAEVSARVNGVHVSKGDVVKPGDPLIDLDDETLRTSIGEAEAAVRAAQANLDQVQEQARPGQIALAQAGVAQAQAGIEAARSALENANRAAASPQDLNAQVHQAQAKVLAAQGDVAQAQAALAALSNQIESAQNDQSMAGKLRLQALQKQQEAARATLQAAEAALAGDQRVLDLTQQTLANPLEILAAQHAAASQVQVAEAGLVVAQAQLDIVQRPPQPEAVALAQARLQSAKANLDLLQAQDKRYTIVSPVGGTVVDKSVDPGETTRPGVALITLADTRQLEITLYVPISNLTAVHLDQLVGVRVPSLPSASYKGKVTFISPDAEFKPDNIYNSQERSEMVYAVRVTVAGDAPDLKAGLPADVIFE